MQTLDIYRHACHHQIHSISSLGKALINISKGVPVDSPERIGRDNAEANLVRDYYECFVWLRGLHHGEKRFDLFQACFIKQVARYTQFLYALIIISRCPGSCDNIFPNQSVTQSRSNTSASL